jgi:hypothetical protein
MGIEDKFQSRRASMSFSLMTGDTMPATMSIVPFMEPIQLFCPASDDGVRVTVCRQVGAGLRRTPCHS